jgi:hypothetical protein
MVLVFPELFSGDSHSSGFSELFRSLPDNKEDNWESLKYTPSQLVYRSGKDKGKSGNVRFSQLPFYREMPVQAGENHRELQGWIRFLSLMTVPLLSKGSSLS